MYQIENQLCKVTVNKKGSELSSFYDKTQEREYIWKGGPVWPKHGPLLFPTIGGFVDNTYLVDQKAYQMPPHGFARDHEFHVLQQTQEEITMELSSSKNTLECYPYPFRLLVSHRLEGKKLLIKWTVENVGEETMYFSIGAHPGFQFAPGTSLTDYRLTFDHKIPIDTYRVKGRLITKEKESLLPPTDTLSLTPDLLRQDALILEEGLSSMVLSCDAADYHLKVSFPHFPVVALWSAPSHIDHAEYLCVEPWCGINDFVGQKPLELRDKYLIQHLYAHDFFSRTFTIEIL